MRKAVSFEESCARPCPLHLTACRGPTASGLETDTLVRTASSSLWSSAPAERWSVFTLVGTVVPVQRTLLNVADPCVSRAQYGHCKPRDCGMSVVFVIGLAYFNFHFVKHPQVLR